MPSEPEVRGERAELASRRILVRPNSEMGWKTTCESSQPSSTAVRRCRLLSVCLGASFLSPPLCFPLHCLLSRLLVSPFVAARCSVPSRRLTSFFFFYDYFLSNSFTASPAFFSRGFCGSSLAAYTHNYLCTLRLLPRQFIPRARREGKTILIRAAAVRVPSDRAPPHPRRGSKLLSFELINTKKKKSFAACLLWK